SLGPLVACLRAGCRERAPLGVGRGVISAPLVVTLVGFGAGLGGLFVFPPLTVVRFGRWSPELMSQQVLSPLVNGFLAATTSYLFIEWVFRRMVVPRAFPVGRLTYPSLTPSLP